MAKAKSIIPCPCCSQAVKTLPLDAVISAYGVPEMEASILRAIWSGNGMPVTSERIFDAMYADDPDGGPSRTKMYDAFKTSLCRLRKRLKKSGVQIGQPGYRKGYRLQLKGAKK